MWPIHDRESKPRAHLVHLDVASPWLPCCQSTRRQKPPVGDAEVPSLQSMRFVDWYVLVDDGFGATPEFARAETDILAAIAAIRWPPGSPEFAIPPSQLNVRPQLRNGVKPIKDAFVDLLAHRGWVPEHDLFDAHLTYGNSTLPFAVEWETGNISSSHRAVNRLALGMEEGRISGGVLVLPTRELYRHLTDRVGNFQELQPYLSLYRRWDGEPGFRYLGIVTVEHDRLDPDAPFIPRGTDGRALI